MKINPEIKERIISTANALVADGIEEPTNAQVLERMGKGSLSHVSPVMREWRESRKAEVVAALEMPADLKKAVETSLGQVWTAASKLASASVDTIRQEADARVCAADQERDEALAEITRLEERLAELQKAIRQVQGDLERERINSATLEKDNATLCDRIAQDNTDLLARVNDKDEQVKSLKAELKEARADNKALQAELVSIAKKAQK